MQFSIGKITRPDANPDEVENVGAIGNVIHSPINQERREELKALMTSTVPSGVVRHTGLRKNTTCAI